MSLINIRFMSSTLMRNTDINVIIPQKQTAGEIGISNNAKSEKYKTLLLLHGLSDDNSIWLRRSSIERYATEYGIAVIMPSADRSFYTDMKHGDKFYTFISKEVLAVAREYLPLSDNFEDNYIAGLSMGGYGAFKIALRNPKDFSAAIGLSSVADVVSFMQVYSPYLMERTFGESVPEQENLFSLLANLKDGNEKQRFFSCIGKNDFMYKENQKLKSAFENTNLDFTYEEFEGVHSWAFWDYAIQVALKWLFKNK